MRTNKKTQRQIILVPHTECRLPLRRGHLGAAACPPDQGLPNSTSTASLHHAYLPAANENFQQWHNKLRRQRRQRTPCKRSATPNTTYEKHSAAQLRSRIHQPKTPPRSKRPEPRRKRTNSKSQRRRQSAIKKLHRARVTPSSSPQRLHYPKERRRPVLFPRLADIDAKTAPATRNVVADAPKKNPADHIGQRSLPSPADYRPPSELVRFLEEKPEIFPIASPVTDTGVVIGGRYV
ncbi:hypothetical protein TB927.1.30 [Trypanosoma brucei brucei TREU927]|uniref:Uncharacterized protein n=1 Tax=Trypanosoma brucei brucei (strain 927/4 GUTat10.1) TaxID=185431 RepID=Q8IFJ4_TRYB2|nr:hypothetical protein TB927.1.30 [Trypanosoma brucei brucei TREU927]CAD53009.1 hypothetical protein TB927.1.30 [Trypanosoma brucei brucei TREU927]